MMPEVPLPEIRVVRDALAAAGARFVEVLHRVEDPSRPAIGEWNIGEAAAHAVSSPSFFLGVARGVTEPEALEEVAANNAAFLASDPERRACVLAERYQRAEQLLLSHVDEVGGDPMVEAFRGVRVPLSTLLAVELGEVLVHGYDIARSAGLSWPIHRAEAAAAAGGMLPLLPHVVDRRAAGERRLRFELRIRRGLGAVLDFDGGNLALETCAGQPVDCHLSIDPVSYLLMSYGRIGPLRPLLQGRLWAWGRRPWVAASFPGLFLRI